MADVSDLQGADELTETTRTFDARQGSQVELAIYVLAADFQWPVGQAVARAGR